ncbi:MAG: hypothetical protein EX285_07425 [Thaumarchaeota archaeon]|nr:hypothetical protein [Nitrososphaerota archaeon]
MSWDPNTDKKKKLIRSMILLALIAIIAGIVTNIIAQQTRSQNPLYQCIESDYLSYDVYLTISTNIDGKPVEIPDNIGILEDCLSPVHTHDNSGLVHVVYDRPYEFRLGHFLWYWGFNIQQYDATVYVNGIEQDKYMDVVLRNNMSIVIDFKSKPRGII